jgi:hypothetical protein
MLNRKASSKNKFCSCHISKELLIGGFLGMVLLLFLVSVLSTSFSNRAIQVLAQTAAISTNNSTLPNATTTVAASSSSKTQSNQTNAINDQLTLGNPFLEEKGKVVVQRITGITNGLPRIETSFSANDTINGNIAAREMGTYVTAPRPNSNVLFAEGQGVITTKDGEMATWTGQGIGHFASDGKLVFRGSLFFTTTSNGKLAFLNNMVGIFQYQADTSGNTSAKVWGWK